MLNELIELSASLRRGGIEPECRHDHVKVMRNTPGVVISLGKDCLPERLEVFESERMRRLFRIERSNHWSFPGFNLDPLLAWSEVTPPPFLSLTNPEERKREFFADIKPLGVSKKTLRLAERLSQQAAKLHEVGIKPREEDRAFAELLKRLITPVDRQRFAESLYGEALKLARPEYGNARDLVETLLLGKWHSRKAKFEGKVPAFLDLDDATSFECRVADGRLRRHLSEIEFAAEEAKPIGTCALTGSVVQIQDQKLPNPNLPSLGPTILMSMNADAPCNVRYGANGLRTFPVGRAVAQDLSSALLWCVSPDRRGRTWATVPSEVHGAKNDLLLVFVDSLPEVPPEFAELVAGNTGERVFEALCSRVGQALEAREVEPSSQIRMVLLRRADKGRVQVCLEQVFSVTDLVEGARSWQRAARARPPMRVGPEAVPPFPVQVLRCSGLRWIRGGSESTGVRSVPFVNVLDVLLALKPASREAAGRVLDAVVSGSGALLAAVGDDRIWKKKGANVRLMREQLAVVTPTLSILLDAVGRPMEVVVNDVAFSLGRFLSLCDLLHREYCKVVRKGQMPPQLLGNSLIPALTRNPVEGLSRTLDRLRIYTAWADRDGTDLALEARGRMAQLALKLTNKLPTTLDATGRAEFLLGYLAAEPFSENKGSGERSAQEV